MATADDDSSSPAPPPPPPQSQPPPLASSLAPGFRFHPTDDELVSYYLKRKVLRRPLRVDAISEVDLYKAVPWDLPQMSRIQSRDMEWYFFSPLDRKYANRSRTNRATGKGYWKTTGKDRTVTRGSRVVGMKKTLVYHIGRAPKGERTNWVMHEYRLEDDELAGAGVAQDEYVVCRIFQKSGAGPQNGAQYGAPFLEEEWENDDNMLLPNVCGSEEQISLPGGYQQLTQVDDDFEQERKDVQPFNGNGQLAVADDQLNTLDFVSVNNGQNITDPLVSNEAQENQGSFTVMDQNILCKMNDDQRFGMDHYCALQEPHHSQGYSEDDYLELKDLIDSPRVDYQGNQLPGIRNDLVSNRFSEITNLPKLHGVEEFFDGANGNEDLQEPIQSFSPFDDSTRFGMNEMLDPVMGNYPPGEQADDVTVYYDAPNHNLADGHGGYIEMNDFLNPVMPGSPTSDPVDELMAYFDATDDQIKIPPLENPPSAESSSSQNQLKAEASGVGVEKRASSTMQLDDEKNANRNDDDYPVAGGMQSSKDWDKTIAGRLVGILGSFPAPPALAAEHPMKEGKSLDVHTSARPSSSMHITAGMIRIDGVTVAGNREHWSIPKSSDVVHLSLESLDLARNGFVSNTEKTHGDVMSLVIRSGICFPILSILFLAISFKMAICIYSR